MKDDVAQVAGWLKSTRLRLGWTAADTAERVRAMAESRGLTSTLTQQAVSYFENGNSKSVPPWIGLFRDAAAKAEHQTSNDTEEPKPDTVGIEEIDQDYGLGGSFTASHVNVQVHQFPRLWVESITSSPPSTLTIASGRGDSMDPTIRDRDMVIIDRSRRKLDEQDAIWALAVGEMGMIKRLRLRGSTVVIQSDNERVADEEVHVDEVHLVGRVVFIGRRT